VASFGPGRPSQRTLAGACCNDALGTKEEAMIIDLIDKLADRAIQLLTLKKQQRADLLQKYVTPVFTEFEQVHSAYLESFARYRKMIQDAEDVDWIQTLQATLDRDNLFTANCRSKVIRLAQAEQDESFGPFIAGIRDYLLGARLVDPLGREVFPRMAQRWRQSLSRTLARIGEEHWQLVIDPNGARPLLDQAEIQVELDQRRAKYPQGKTPDGLKRASALWALDEVVWEMQRQYDLVCEAYTQLQSSLSR
jgi:hypothetical protein